MGLFDAFGAGGGTVTVQLQGPTAQAGGILAGAVTFTAGKRAQQIKVLTGRLMCSIANAKGGAPQSIEVVPTFKVAGAFASLPGEARQFPFEVQVPPTAQDTVPNAVTYTFSASADIDGEIDPGDSAGVNITGGVGQGQYPGAQGWTTWQSPLGNANVTSAHAQAQWSNGQWYGATVVQFDGSRYLVRWDDGSPELWVNPDQVQLDEGKGIAPKDQGGWKAGFSPGDHCQAQWSDGQWYGATVVQSDKGQYLVRWDDGSPDLWVNPDQVSPG